MGRWSDRGAVVAAGRWWATAALLGLAGVGCGSGASQTGPPASEPAGDEPSTETVAVGESHADQAAETEEIVVHLGTCDVSWAPPVLLEDVSEAETAVLVATVTEWLGSDYPTGVAGWQGIAFAKSDDDVGWDGPVPSANGRYSELTCGVHTVWLLTWLTRQVRWHAGGEYGTLRCQENVCCYDAEGEYDSSGTLFFRYAEELESWVLDGAAIVADNATLDEEWVAELRSWVSAELAAKAAESCADHPPEW